MADVPLEMRWPTWCEGSVSTEMKTECDQLKLAQDKEWPQLVACTQAPGAAECSNYAVALALASVRAEYVDTININTKETYKPTPLYPYPPLTSRYITFEGDAPPTFEAGPDPWLWAAVIVGGILVVTLSALGVSLWQGWIAPTGTWRRVSGGETRQPRPE